MLFLFSKVVVIHLVEDGFCRLQLLLEDVQAGGFHLDFCDLHGGACVFYGLGEPLYRLSGVMGKAQNQLALELTCRIAHTATPLILRQIEQRILDHHGDQ